MLTRIAQFLCVCAIFMSQSLFSAVAVQFEGDYKEFIIEDLYGWKEVPTQGSHIDIAYVNRDHSKKIAFACDLYYHPVTKEDFEDPEFVVASWLEMIQDLSNSQDWHCVKAVSLGEDRLFYGVFECSDWRPEYRYSAFVLYGLDSVHLCSCCLLLNDLDSLPDECIDLLKYVKLAPVGRYSGG